MFSEIILNKTNTKIRIYVYINRKIHLLLYVISRKMYNTLSRVLMNTSSHKNKTFIHIYVMLYYINLRNKLRYIC